MGNKVWILKFFLCVHCMRVTDASFSSIHCTLVPSSEYPRLFDVTRDRQGKLLTSVSIQPPMSLKHNHIVLDHTAYSNDIIVSSGTKVTGVGLYDPFTTPEEPKIFKLNAPTDGGYKSLGGRVLLGVAPSDDPLLIPVDYYDYNGNYYWFDPDGILFNINATNATLTLQTDPVSIAPVALTIPDGSFIGQQLSIVVISTYSSTDLYTNFPSHGSVIPAVWTGSDWKRIDIT